MNKEEAAPQNVSSAPAFVQPLHPENFDPQSQQFFGSPPPTHSFGLPLTQNFGPPPTHNFGPPPTHNFGSPVTQNFGPPQLQGYPLQPQATIVVPAQLFGDFPIHTVCTNCRQSIVTTITKLDGSCTWVWCFVLCLCCFPFCFIPFVTDCSKDVRHACPNCDSILGVSKQI